MREIEFRAWCKKITCHPCRKEGCTEMVSWVTDYADADSGAMLDVVAIHFHRNQVMIRFPNGGFGQQDLDDAVLMQFTGLRDKHGREIYEGDILDDSYVNPMTKEKIIKLYEVVFKSGSFWAKHKESPYGDSLLYFINKRSKVIGNIWDNPELLEA